MTSTDGEEGEDDGPKNTSVEKSTIATDIRRHGAEVASATRDIFGHPSDSHISKSGGSLDVSAANKELKFAERNISEGGDGREVTIESSTLDDVSCLQRNLALALRTDKNSTWLSENEDQEHHYSNAPLSGRSHVGGTGTTLSHPDAATEIISDSDARNTFLDLERGMESRARIATRGTIPAGQPTTEAFTTTLRGLSERVIGDGKAFAVDDDSLGADISSPTRERAERRVVDSSETDSRRVQSKSPATAGTVTYGGADERPSPRLQNDNGTIQSHVHQPTSQQTENSVRPSETDWPSVTIQRTSLSGKSLTVFGPQNSIRQFLNRVIHQAWFQPLIFLVLILHLFVVSWELSHSIFGDDPADGPLFENWKRWWGDIVLFAIFIFYSAEITAKAIVQGLWYDDYHSPFPGWIRLIKRAMNSWRSTRNPSASQSAREESQSSEKATKASHEEPIMLETFERLVIGKEKAIPVERAFLRHSWNRIDFLSTMCYWISLLLTINGTDVEHRLFVFRALSTLRLWRLLNLTRGTSSILRSLKRGLPMLFNVSSIIGIFW